MVFFIAYWNDVNYNIYENNVKKGRFVSRRK